MYDTTIVLSMEDTTLSVDSTHYTLRSQGKKFGRIPPGIVRQFIIHPWVQVSKKALERLGKTGVAVTFLDYEGRVNTRLVPPWKFNAVPRIEQARLYLDPKLRLGMARRWVDAKIANAATVLRQHASNRPNPELREKAKDLLAIRKNLLSATDINSLMGYEGVAGRIYFSVFQHMLHKDWAIFEGRNRRPPKDPVNAILSYCYGILCNLLHSFVEGGGLDPYIGYLHQPETNRPSLVLDLMEPFRPVLADRLTLRLINLGSLNLDHFETPFPGNATRITLEGRKLLLQQFFDWETNCDRTLGDPDDRTSLPSPHSLLKKEVDRYISLATNRKIEEFVPFYLDRSHAKSCPDLDL